MSGTCYGHETPNHNGSPNPVVLPHYWPCNPQTDSITQCCETGDTCLSNGLCMASLGLYYNGGCTDSTLQAAICPRFCTLGIANTLVQCHGSAVKDGDFCCSAHHKFTTCCETASNGLGLIAEIPAGLPVSARPDGASTVPTFVSTGTAPELISSGATTSSSGSITGSPSSSTSLRRDTFDNPDITPLPERHGIPLAILGSLAFVLLFGGILGIARLINRYKLRRRQRTHTNDIPLNPMGNQQVANDNSGSGEQPTDFEVAATEDEDTLFGTEVEGSPVVPFSPLDTGASGNPVDPMSPTPSDIAARDTAPDNRQFREPQVEVAAPMEMDASETADGPTNPPPSDVAAQHVAPDNEPLRTEVECSQVGPEVEGPPDISIEVDPCETPDGPTDPPPSYVAAPDVAPDNEPLCTEVEGSPDSSIEVDPNGTPNGLTDPPPSYSCPRCHSRQQSAQ